MCEQLFLESLRDHSVSHGNELETALQGIAIRGQEHRSGGGQMLHADRLELKLAQAFQPEPGAYQEIRQLERNASIAGLQPIDCERRLPNPFAVQR